MKKTIYIKETLLKVIFVTTISLLASCSNDQESEDTKAIAEEHNEAKFDNKEQEKDAQFLVNAAGISLVQIQLGQLAQQNGRTEHVKELGKMMVDAHTKSLNDLKALAKRKTISIPTSPTYDAKEAYKELNDESGSDFDKTYTDMMVSEHENAIEIFEEASKDSYDKDIRSWAKNALPDLRKHLDRSIDCQKKLD